MPEDKEVNWTGRHHVPIEIRLWDRVDIGEPSECWEWQGNRDKDGYGQIYWQGRYWGTHQVAWMLAHPGETVSGRNQPVMHSCDNPPCCNPAHLSRGTTQLNNLDARQKGRYQDQCGEKRYNAQLTDDLVRSIRLRYSAGEAAATIARELDANAGMIHRAAIGVTWKHVTDVPPAPRRRQQRKEGLMSE